ncbi:MAG: aldehyde dehydrogenase (NADP(+)) [Myxococcales bacterium]|nr:aldehyde dehydrogenase (NADP(+)) [Myxococcales bacterium]
MTTNRKAHFIAGVLSADPHAPTFEAFDPATRTALPFVYPEATAAEVDRAAAAAEAAFDPFRALPGEKRGAFLEAVAQRIEALGADLIETAHKETGLPVARLEGERARTLGQLRIFAELARTQSWVGARIDRGDPERKPLPRPDVRSHFVPVGPVVVFGASNFPLAISTAGTDTVSALAVGCPVIVKAHPSHPGTSDLLATAFVQAARDTGMPAGVFSMLHGRSVELGRRLVEHPAVTAVAFTGSAKAGRALFDLAAARPCPIPVYAEMGSVNPVFVLPDALAQRGPTIASQFVQSLTMGVGQFCTNPGLVFACEGPALAAFVDALANPVASFAPSTMLNAGICQAFEAGVAKLESTAGVKLVTRSQAAAAPGQAGGHVFQVPWRVFKATPHLAHEVFGPISVLVTCESVEEMLEAARGLEGQLTATIHTTDDEHDLFSRLAFALEPKVGRLVVNGFPTGIEVCAAMHHGGPYPATTHGHFTSIGHAALYRFVRPVAYQNHPPALLPPSLRDDNPLGLTRVVNGRYEAP